MSSDPVLCQDKERVSKILADEWKQIKSQPQTEQTQYTQSSQRIVRASHIWSLEDGRAPKRALTPYMLFVKERKYDLMAEFPAMAFGKMM